MAQKVHHFTEDELKRLCDKVAKKAAKEAASKAYEEGKKAGENQAHQATGKKTAKYELDHERKMGVDERDPRHLGEGPCRNTHSPKPYTNQWAVWKDCTKCCLRMEYTPYTHSPSQTTKTDNAENVREALQELREAGVWANMEAKQMRAKIKEVSARKMKNYKKPEKESEKDKAKTRSKPKAAEEFHIGSDAYQQEKERRQTRPSFKPSERTTRSVPSKPPTPPGSEEEENAAAQEVTSSSSDSSIEVIPGVHLPSDGESEAD